MMGLVFFYVFSPCLSFLLSEMIVQKPSSWSAAWEVCSLLQVCSLKDDRKKKQETSIGILKKRRPQNSQSLKK